MFWFYVLTSLVIGAAAVWLMCRVVQLSAFAPGKEIEQLDRVCLATNILLGIVYLPLSFQAIFSSTLHIADGTALQEFLCQLHSVLLGLLPLPAYGGLVVSWKLRDNCHSVRSFFFQFLGCIHLSLVSLIPVLITRIR